MRGSKLLRWLDHRVGSILVFLFDLFRQMSISSSRRKSDTSNILVIKLAALGDTLLLVPSLRTIRRNFPAARIHFLGTSINEDLIKLFPAYVDDFTDFNPKRAIKNPVYFFKTMRSLRSRRIDIVFDFEQWSFATPLIAFWTGAPARYGFSIDGSNRHLLYTSSYHRRKDVHEVKNFLNLLESISIRAEAPTLELPVGEDSVKRTRSKLRENGWDGSNPVVVLHPGCGSHGFPREWPLENFAELCRRIRKDRDLFFVVTGGPSEKGLTHNLAAILNHKVLEWDDTSLDMLIGLLSTSTLLISGNNGVMHLAAALGIPQIALHGPTDSAKWGPLNPRSVVLRSHCPGCPCLDLGFEFHRTDGFCMRQIPVDEVYDAVAKVLSDRPQVSTKLN